MKQCSQQAKAILALSLFAIVAKTNPQVTSKYRNCDTVKNYIIQNKRNLSKLQNVRILDNEGKQWSCFPF